MFFLLVLLTQIALSFVSLADPVLQTPKNPQLIPRTTYRNKSSHKNLPLPSSKEIFNGDLTYYSPGPGYGACGYENTDQDSICAVSHFLWDAVSTSSNPNNNPLCGKMIRITRFNPTKGSNSSVDVMIVDRCTGCKETDLDLSIKMFTTLAEEAQGRVVGSWAWLN
jgi:hypothetical protein